MSLLHKCLLVTLSVLCAGCGICNGYMERAPTEIKNGKCVYHNRTLGHHESIQFENPCQAWFCNAETHKVYIGGCTPNPPIEECVEVQGNGTYPDCCPRLVCEGQRAR
ncbi:uncharacterized protein LOC119397411 [Rhipicephalus sanguineus]|uniref:uncharacterized protein LOC119397411 n=1 Tax=Rhipicephalus sanguineus TaxID=34632 RepID=UPI001893750A|nr:uncharacterized protein LOC119397411 [Rhipicephalus sanguineus]